MPELTPSTREAARRIGVTEMALRKAATKGRIERETDDQWDVEKTRRRMVETADPVRSPLAANPALSADATPYARLRVAQLALKVEAQRMALDTEKGRLLDAATANRATANRAIDKMPVPWEATVGFKLIQSAFPAAD